VDFPIAEGCHVWRRVASSFAATRARRLASAVKLRGTITVPIWVIRLYSVSPGQVALK
jgi:hypothetical protein